MFFCPRTMSRFLDPNLSIFLRVIVDQQRFWETTDLLPYHPVVGQLESNKEIKSVFNALVFRARFSYRHVCSASSAEL